MPEFGAIFDYHESAMAFGYTTVAFMLFYTMIAIWAAAHSEHRIAGAPQAA